MVVQSNERISNLKQRLHNELVQVRAVSAVGVLASELAPASLESM